MNSLSKVHGRPECNFIPSPPETTAFLQRFSGLPGSMGTKRLIRFHAAMSPLSGLEVGSWAAESLRVPASVALTLIDLDDICISNTNRQIHTLSGTVGQTKSR